MTNEPQPNVNRSGRWRQNPVSSMMGWVRQRWPEQQSAANLLTALLVSGVAYRLVLATQLMTAEAPPLSFVPNADHLARLLSHAPREIIFAAVVTTGWVALTGLVRRVVPGRLLRSPWPSRVVLTVLLLVVGIINATHIRLCFSVQRGLEWALLTEWLLAGGDTGGASSYATVSDFALAGLPALTFLLGGWLLRKRPGWHIRTTIALAGLTLLTLVPHYFIPRTDPKAIRTPTPLRRIPTWFFVADAWANLTREPGHYETLAANVPHDRDNPLPLPSVPPANRADETEADWNVVLILMESVGERYVFDTSRGNEMPMPFFHRLANRGLYLAQHVSTGNTSPRAIFSLFTGLYPLPQHHMFSTRADLRVPNLGTFLPHTADRFLVTPSQIQFYFPLGLMRHAGLHELVGFDDLPKNPDRPPWRGGRNELDGFDFFVDRLSRAKPPFLAVYYSYAPHYDYDDHGPEYRVLADLTHPQNRYFNGLRLLDTGIERMVNTVADRDLLDRTVFVFVGDHGEAFGQHPGNWTHSGHSFEENFHVPALLYNEQLFTPQRVVERTSHIDVLPTLLDAMDVWYDPAQFQGKSLLRSHRSEWVFTYGNEDVISVVDRHEAKLQISFAKDFCRVFDLPHDPDEAAPLPCDPYPEHVRAALWFRQNQGRELSRYNELF